MITLSQHIAFCLLACPWVLHRTLHILSNDPNMEWILTHDTHIKKKKKKCLLLMYLPLVYRKMVAESFS